MADPRNSGKCPYSRYLFRTADAESGIPRDEVFVGMKSWINDRDYRHVRPGVGKVREAPA